MQGVSTQRRNENERSMPSPFDSVYGRHSESPRHRSASDGSDRYAGESGTTSAPRQAPAVVARPPSIGGSVALCCS